MLIQCFAQNKTDVSLACEMLSSFFQRTLFEISLWRNMQEGAYHIEKATSLSDALETVDNHLVAEYDNIGVYYNYGETIFVKIYKNAKYDFAAFRHPDTEPDETQNTQEEK